ncbi:MAG TPA: sigma-70 family RNA polymerase sigma factor [Thermoanaerobaculia bacterium]|nr:sigma-70 family RNA polymerase sigma factor [Thermoanaerobaculia bacterium]
MPRAGSAGCVRPPAEDSVDSSEPSLSDCIAELLRRMRPAIGRLFGRYHIPLAEAEDLLQDALMIMAAKWPGIINRQAWLLGTLRHHCLQYLRQTCRHRLQTVDPSSLEELAGADPPALERRDRALDLDRLVTALPQRQQRVLFLVYRLGMTHREAEPLVGFAAETLRKDGSRAIAHLRRLAAPETSLDSSSRLAARPRPTAGGRLPMVDGRHSPERSSAPRSPGRRRA